MSPDHHDMSPDDENEIDSEDERDTEDEVDSDLEGEVEDDRDEVDARPRRDDDPVISRRTAVLMTAAGVVGGAALGAGGMYFTMRGGGRRPPPPMKAAFVPLADHSPSKGPAPAKITVVEFSDFQCPYCARGNKTVTELLAKHPDDIRLVMRHNPLPFHPQAKPAALAMQAALRQDAAKAWQLHDQMFDHRKNLSDPELKAYAEKAGLDLATFDRDRASEAVKKEVATDQALAKKVGARGTPTFFINGVPLRGARPLDAFEDIVKEELDAVAKLLSGGTTLAAIYETRAKHHVAKGTKS